MSWSSTWSLNEGMTNSDREESGVYQLLNADGTVIYIGSADNLKKRMKEHVNEKDNDCIKKNAKSYRLEYCSNHKKREKELYDEQVRTFGRAPSCNKIAPSGY
jgi:predicted GIY-YIG superfamily endonuclease